MAVRCENLTVAYGNRPVVQDVSLHVAKGEFCTLVGPNGCGKSTLLKGLSHTLIPRSGGIFINGRPIKGMDRKALARQLAFLPQSPRIPDQVSVRELVGHGRFSHTGWSGFLKQEDREVVDWALEVTELTDYGDRELIHLSGGERQRVWIALALAQEAEILFLDEPTTYLDINHQFQILELILRLNREMGRTVLMVLHDLNQAARYSDRLLVMKEGRLATQGKAEEILTEENLHDLFSIEARIIRDEENHCPHIIPIGGKK
ncbi:MAG: ABC transporter ATP-binding protein [Spirochaetales bacterium]|nr:ABC transporter ATP-binding protein [Spirochaetales bacterium]